MSEQTPESGENKDKSDEVTTNSQPTEADQSPIPQPPTDGFPAGEEDLTSRVPGESKDLTQDDED